MNEGLQFPTELDVDLGEANLRDDSDSKLGMIDSISDGELILHRVGAEWTAPLGIGLRALLLGGSGRGPSRGRFGRTLTVDMVALAGSALNALDGAVIPESGDDMLATLFAFSAPRLDVSTKLRFDDDS